MKVLVADDEATARLVLKRTLQRFGYEAEAVQDGDQAWQLLRDESGPQIAVLDWNMPRMSGIELCQRLRSSQLARYVYVILVTSRSQTEDMVAGLAAGADDFISKPVDPEQLGARLRTAKRIVELQSESERSRSYLTAILATIDCGVLLSDARGRVVYSNEMLARMSSVPTAQSVDELRDRFPWSNAGHPGHAASVAASHPGEGGSRDFELQAPRRVFRQTTVPVVLPEGAGTLDIYRDITAEVEYASQVVRLAMTDALTGASNRRGGQEAMHREMSRARRTGASLTFVLFDIDRFKQVNDAFGHEIGDRVLQQVAKILIESVRVTDVVARWGGEEFLLLLSATTASGALILADRIRLQVDNHRHPELPPVTVSAGIAEVRPEDISGADALRRADERLYSAKNSGRNCVR
jgi:two-component system cell cycle response regulator